MLDYRNLIHHSVVPLPKRGTSRCSYLTMSLDKVF